MTEEALSSYIFDSSKRINTKECEELSKNKEEMKMDDEERDLEDELEKELDDELENKLEDELEDELENGLENEYECCEGYKREELLQMQGSKIMDENLKKCKWRSFFSIFRILNSVLYWNIISISWMFISNIYVLISRFCVKHCF